MSSYTFNKKEERESKIKSAIITAIIWLAILLFVFTYTFKITSMKEKENITTMLINFGDNRNGNGTEEPAEQEGSLAAKTETPTPEPVTTIKENPIKEVVKETKKEKVAEKIITGNNPKTTVKNTEKSETKKEEKKDMSKAGGMKSHKNNTSTKAEKTNAKTGTGDGLGNAAIGNLIKGKGKKPGNQGDGKGMGNAGDPLGGEGNGDSRIGIDRKLIGFIPGTMGRGGAQPPNKCSASGTITISYTVDKAGNVTSANRLSGSSDACIVNTSIGWVKRYVKAEKAGVSSKGTYKITF